MSRSNHDKPFYVDVGTSIVAIRCASNHDVLIRRDHVVSGPLVIEEIEHLCDRLNKEADEWKRYGALVPYLRRIGDALDSIDGKISALWDERNLCPDSSLRASASLREIKTSPTPEAR